METIAFENRTLQSTAAVLLNNIIKVRNTASSKAEQLSDALRPFAVIQWTRPLIEKLGVAKINRMFGRLKRSPITKTELRLVIDHFRIALSDRGALMPDEFAEWRTLLTRYSLNLLADYATWTGVLGFLLKNKIDTPAQFAELSLQLMNDLAKISPYEELIGPLWQAVRLEFASAKGVTPFTLKFRSENFSLVGALKAKNVQESEFGNELESATLDLQLPENFSKLGPKARIIALQNVVPESQALYRFLSIGAQANILEQVRLTLPAVSSGISCYLSFCSLLAVAPFPPSTECVARRSAVSPPGKTFSLYLGHLAKACFLLGFDLSWKNEFINSIAKGLKNKPSERAKFHNSLEPSTLDRIIRHETWGSEFARLCYVTYLFMLRLPS